MSNTTNLNLFKHDNPEQNTNAFDVEEALNKNWDKIDTYAGNINTDLAEKGTDITNIKAEQITQNTNIQTNANNISSLQSRTGTNETDISNIKTEQTQQNNRIGALEGDNTTNKTNIATLQTDSGHTISLDLNTTTYVLTATLKNKAGTTLNTSSIDLPIEQLVVSVSYDKNTKVLVITLKNGEITRVPLGDLVSGLQTEITSSNKLSSDLVDDTNHTHKFVSAGEKETWNAKYNKPSGGIPKTDLTTEVQTSLEKAGTALQQHQDISGKEDKSNKVTSIDDESTDIQYPSAKCVYDSQQNQNTKIVKLELENQRLKQTLVTTPGTGENITLNKTAEMEFVIPPLPEGNTKQNTTEGYNLAYIEAEGKYRQYENGNLRPNADFNSYIARVEPNIDYRAVSLGGQTDFSNLCFFDENMNYISGNALTTQSNTKAFTTVANCKYVTIAVNINVNEFMVIKGTTVPTSYEPYTNGASPNPEYEQEVQVVKGDIEVDIENKNFFDFSDTIITTPKTYKANLIQVIKLEKGKYYTPHLKYTKELYKNDNWVSENGFGAIVLFKSDTILSDELSYDGVYSGSNVLLKNEASTVDGNTIFQATTNYLLVYAVAVNFQNRFTIGECSLNKTEDNIKDLTYTPHKEQKLPLTLGDIELCKIGDYKDKFEKDNGVWKIPNKILKIDSYNGETITTPYISSTGGLDIGATVYYVGDNALEITDTTLINQLEAIYNAISYYEQTNISGTSSGISPLFDVEAYQNTKLLLEDIINSN